MRILSSEQSLARKYGVSPDSILVVNVVLEEVDTIPIAASYPTTKVESGAVIENFVLQEYEDFVMNVMGIFPALNIDVIDYVISEQSGVSHYWYFFPPNSTSKRLIIFRLSNHFRHAGKTNTEKSTLVKQDNTKHQARVAKLTGNPKQRYKLKEIVVNGSLKATYNNYDDALEGIDRWLESL
jgi:hypothetical protein